MLADRFSFLKQDRSLFSFFYILELSHPFQFYPIQYKIYDTTSLPQAALIPFIYETKLIQVSCQSYIKNIFSNKGIFMVVCVIVIVCVIVVMCCCSHIYLFNFNF